MSHKKITRGPGKRHKDPSTAPRGAYGPPPGCCLLPSVLSCCGPRGQMHGVTQCRLSLEIPLFLSLPISYSVQDEKEAVGGPTVSVCLGLSSTSEKLVWRLVIPLKCLPIHFLLNKIKVKPTKVRMLHAIPKVVPAFRVWIGHMPDEVLCEVPLRHL